MRITNSRIITQIVHATLNGDRTICQADSTELKRWGITAGLTNYPSAYCTGLLLARRLLQQLGMDQMYKGATTVSGKKYDVSRDQKDNTRRPFKALLDVGLQRTTTGHRVFGALKGACDGGLYIPHSTRRFPGSSKSNKRSKVKYDGDAHRNRIFGLHIETYSYGIEEQDEALYAKRFGDWSACIDSFINSGKIGDDGSYEELYTLVHKGIREDPSFTKKTKKE